MKKSKTSFKEFRLDAEGLFSKAIHGHGYLHYGYFPDKTTDNSIGSLGKAQQFYFDKISNAISSNVSRILDVGSGTGSNAESLTKIGYHVDCLCPSEKLNSMARQKLPATSTVWDTEFESFNHDKTYDMILCAESFHYIKPMKAIEQFARYTSGSVIIFDYFLHNKDEEDGWKLSHQGFLDLIKKDGNFKISIDEDCTDSIKPTFETLDSLRNDTIGPFVEKAWETFKKEYPTRAFFINLVLGKKIKRFITKKSNRTITFPKRFSYRFIKLERI